MDITSLSSNSPLITLTRHYRSLLSTKHNKHHSSLSFHHPINCTSSSNTKDDNDAASVKAPTTAATDQEPKLRIRTISRRQARRQREINGTVTKSLEKPKKEKVPKKWEEMNLTEKAMELYVGEKGALFWLNKFAYASIFIMIGAWILFRFVGPALDIYQLDKPLLSPTDVLKGSS